MGKIKYFRLLTVIFIFSLLLVGCSIQNRSLTDEQNDLDDEIVHEVMKEKFEKFVEKSKNNGYVVRMYFDYILYSSTEFYNNGEFITTLYGDEGEAVFDCRESENYKITFNGRLKAFDKSLCDDTMMDNFLEEKIHSNHYEDGLFYDIYAEDSFVYGKNRQFYYAYQVSDEVKGEKIKISNDEDKYIYQDEDTLLIIKAK